MKRRYTVSILTAIKKIWRLGGPHFKGLEMSENTWAITGRLGLYYGTYPTRKEAIEDHTKSLGRTWHKCKLHGDRAIKVKVVPVTAII